MWMLQLTGINAEPGVVHFKAESLQCRVGLNPQHFQSLHIKVLALPEYKDQWSGEELQVIKTNISCTCATRLTLEYE